MSAHFQQLFRRTGNTSHSGGRVTQWSRDGTLPGFTCRRCHSPARTGWGMLVDRQLSRLQRLNTVFFAPIKCSTQVVGRPRIITVTQKPGLCPSPYLCDNHTRAKRTWWIEQWLLEILPKCNSITGLRGELKYLWAALRTSTISCEECNLGHVALPLCASTFFSLKWG